MNAIDTNVLVYRLDRQEPIKQAKARDLLRRLSSDPTPTLLLWQVLGELMRQLRSWQDQGRITRDTVLR
ncbi:MAG: PIN domain-containing protein [Candidatus Anammoximicrobium sp.]|nr:PIN domain-containing protein [Candidatus Anammoximicrobium sp.]